jgi:hypothetical protein
MEWLGSRVLALYGRFVLSCWGRGVFLMSARHIFVDAWSSFVHTLSKQFLHIIDRLCQMQRVLEAQGHGVYYPRQWSHHVCGKLYGRSSARHMQPHEWFVVDPDRVLGVV